MALGAEPAAATNDRQAHGQGSYFGPDLAPGASFDQYVRDLQEAPSATGATFSYPLDSEQKTRIREFLQAAAREGAVAQLTLEPRVDLTELTARDAEELARLVQELHSQLESRIVIRFAPEMNGTWVRWGQQPVDYVKAFQAVADAVHRTAPSATMLWAPAYGSGYPFDARPDATTSRHVSEADTNANGVLDADDDPYDPYYPGDAAADWVGLSVYHYGTLLPDDSFAINQAPEPGKFAAQLAGTYGYETSGDSRRDFVTRFATGKGKELALQTGALFSAATPGATEEEIKSGWIRQVAAATGSIKPAMVTWLEQVRPEDEARGAQVDWRATANADVAQTLREILGAGDSPFMTGPVTPVHDISVNNAAPAQIRNPGTTTGDPMGWITASVAALAVLALAGAATMRFKRSWSYGIDPDPRDIRLDLLRGWIICAVVVTHIEVAGPFSFFALNIGGAITGAELFVLLSGIVMGMVHPRAVQKIGGWEAAIGNGQRALKQYLTALAVVIAVFLISRIPFIDASVVTTFTDRGTGENGTAAAGRVYDLYANAPLFFDYPVPVFVIEQLVRLDMGPWVYNIMGLFVVLTLSVPPLMWLLRRGLWWLVLALSWSLYVLDAQFHIRLFDSQFQDVFPLLTWQIAFLHGLVIGYYRDSIARFVLSRRGLILISMATSIYALALGTVWASHAYGLQLPGVTPDVFGTLYSSQYDRTFLQPGRLLNLLFFLSVGYIVLTAFWKPLNRAFGWLYVPLGQASMYVFTVHVFFVLLIGNVPGLDRSSAWQGLAIHAVVIAAIWLMVRYKVLFNVIPR
ncbi:OpgC domain-containing protein [Paenarthrobacter sp. NPDC089714]|uniref:OpgC domain-containing protein n=1 Tax=Paenarthrobacter sp. NPDC089714 TaxID=3364377 RepID=UPI0037FE9360